jgi:hypothetical protein
MNSSWQIRMLALLAPLLLIWGTACQQQASPPGIEIPQGTMPEREPTYDDIDPTPGGLSYIGNGYEYGKMSEWKKVETVDVAVAGNIHIVYRNYIETKAGEVRYNIIYTGYQAVHLKLAGETSDIQVMEVGTPPKENVLMIVIPPQVKPGDYSFGLQVFVNGQYKGVLPCVIHVVE